MSMQARSALHPKQEGGSENNGDEDSLIPVGCLRVEYLLSRMHVLVTTNEAHTFQRDAI
jgi:hypothetical protein